MGVYHVTMSKSINYETFDIDSCTKSQMNKLADNIENYRNSLFDKMIIPEEDYEKMSKSFKAASKVIDELVDKLRKGKKSVFVDDDY